MEQEKDLSALKNFLMDIDCLEKLEENSFNLFDVLKIARTEIRHSNVISWLLDPNESHGLGNKVISAFNSEIVKIGMLSDNDAFKLLTMNYNDITVYREWNHIDILVESISEKYVLCIENKIGIQDHDNQLDRYVDVIEKHYPDFTKIYMYLTPEGVKPLNDYNDVWQCIKYETLISIFENQIKKISLDKDVRSFIESYINVLKRETMENLEIVELCQNIYRKHKDALDLIFENRPDRLLNVSEYFKEWCKNKSNAKEIIFDETKSSKSYMRFRTENMDKYIKESKNLSSWGTKNHYYYEISSYYTKNDDIKYAIQLVFNSTNLEDDNLKQLEDIIKKQSKNKLKDGWQWKTVCKTQTKTIKNQEILPEIGEDENIIFKDLDKLLTEIIKKEKEIMNM